MNVVKIKKMTYKKRYTPKGPFKVLNGMEMKSGNGFFKRFYYLLTNPFRYLFKGEIRY